VSFDEASPQLAQDFARPLELLLNSGALGIARALALGALSFALFRAGIHREGLRGGALSLIGERFFEPGDDRALMVLLLCLMHLAI
jgi:hypothetical protein